MQCLLALMKGMPERTHPIVSRTWYTMFFNDNVINVLINGNHLLRILPHSKNSANIHVDSHCLATGLTTSTRARMIGSPKAETTIPVVKKYDSSWQVLLAASVSSLNLLAIK